MNQLALIAQIGGSSSIKLVCDTGATGNFTGEDADLEDVTPLDPPVEVTLGTTKALARYKGNKLAFPKGHGKQSALRLQFYMTKGFHKNLWLVSGDMLNDYGLTFVFEKPHSYMFSKKIDIKVPLLRAQNGLRYIQIGQPDRSLATRDIVSGKQINWKAANLNRHIAETCTLVCKKRVRFGSANLVAHTCFMDDEETGCDISDDGWLTGYQCHPATVRPPAEPPPGFAVAPSDILNRYKPMRTFLIGPGLFSEATSAFDNMPLEIAGAVEVGENYSRIKKQCRRKYGRKVSVYKDLDTLNGKLERDEVKLPEFDLLVCTLPCQNVTVLRKLNGYETTKTAHLFTKSQLKFIKLVQPGRILKISHVSLCLSCPHYQVESLQLKPISWPIW